MIKNKFTVGFKKMLKGMSLVEVLVATSIIAVSIYGIMMVLSAQQMADGRLRDKQILTQLHYQLIREFLKNQRNEWSVKKNGSTAITLEGGNTDITGFGGAVLIPLVNPMLGTGVVAYFRATSSLSGGAGDMVINSSLYTKQANVSPAITLASSNISIFYPYYYDYKSSGVSTTIRPWTQVQP